MIKYTVEKILYLANQEKPFNVDVREESCTDISVRLVKLLSGGYIEEVGRDDYDVYYRTTKKGKIYLLQLQIQWRKAHNKSTDLHELELAGLKG